MQGLSGRAKSELCRNVRRTPFASQGIDKCWVDECRSRDVLRAERGNAGLPKMLEDLARRFRGVDKIWAGGATWIEVESLVLGDFCGFDTGQDHLPWSLLPGGRKLAGLNIEFPVTTKLEEGFYVAHTNGLGLGVVPCRDGLGNVDEGLALGDQELMRLFVEEEVEERVPDV